MAQQGNGKIYENRAEDRLADLATIMRIYSQDIEAILESANKSKRRQIDSAVFGHLILRRLMSIRNSIDDAYLLVRDDIRRNVRRRAIIADTPPPEDTPNRRRGRPRKVAI